MKCDLVFYIFSLLPAPSQPVWDREEEVAKSWAPPSSALVLTSPTAPPYGQRRGWVPRAQEVSILTLRDNHIDGLISEIIFSRTSGMEVPSRKFSWPNIR